MPYRRLPNTDQARMRALKIAIAKGELCDTKELPFSFNILSEARNFLKKFEAAHKYYIYCYENQVGGSARHQANFKIARLYISHFIQVLSMSVMRLEIKSHYKKLYGLPDDNNSVPDLATETAVVEWGERIIDGERKRTSQGGVPIYNPTIAKVKVHYDIFVDSYEKQKALQNLTNRSLEEVASLRTRADELILHIWNRIEAKFQDILPNEERLQKCRDFGLVYYYRTSEKQSK